MIAILIPEFPSQTHVFFWREIEALRAQGQPVKIISTRCPVAAACPHEFATAAAAETLYLYPPRWITAVATLAMNPVRALAALRYCFGLRQTPWPRRLAKFGLLPCAADLLQYSRRENIDHIHSHSCGESGHLVALCRILGGPPYSLTLHGDLPVYGRDHSKKMGRAAFVATAGPHLIPQVVEQAGVPSERVYSTLMGLDMTRFRDVNLRAYKPDRLHVVTIARLHRSKGHRHALAAIRTAVDLGLDVNYTIAGSGPHALEIETEVQQLGLGNRVKFVGSLSELQVLELLQRADAFVLPSVGAGEAWPVSLMEAMACGLPVIASVIGSPASMIENDVDGLLVRQGDETALADAFVSLARDPELRRRLGAAARLRAESSFNVRDSAQRLITAIKGSRD
jgi:colanic acid/amylovoran biosynthesis glycosyltransferase